jgi:hypothetical protein
LNSERRTVLTLVLLAVGLNAQTKEGSWAGVLRDDSGAAITDAVLRLAGGSTHLSTTTDQEGHFSFPTIPSGEYSLAIDSRGATANHATRLQLPDSRVAAIVLGSSGTISFSASEQREGTGGERLTSKQVSGLPLNKRDFSQLLLLAAGTMTDNNGSANFTQQFAVNGQRGTAAVFAMDSVDSTDPEIGGATFTNFNVDAVQEIRSSSGWMPAEIGRGAAAFTDVITRSGTNALHGSVFEFLRNSALDARNFFDRQSIADPRRIPPFIRNEFGFTNGGPVVIPRLYDGRNRTFYFLEYQGFRQVLSATEIIPVPSAAERAGLDTTAFPGDTLIVPVDPRIAKYMDRYPMPNDPAGPYGARTYATSSKVDTVSDQISARLDHRISEKSQLFARFTGSNTEGPLTNPSQTAIDPSFVVLFTNQQRNAAVTYTRSQTANLVFRTSFSFTRATPQFPTQNHTDPGLVFADASYETFNAAAGSVMAWFGNLGQIQENFAWTRGRHTVKGGGEVRMNRDTSLFGINPNGQYWFGGGAAYSPVLIRSASGTHDILPGAPLPDALTGLLTASPFTYTTVVAPPLFPQGDRIGAAAIHRDAYNFYLQDSWRVSSRLLLNYGLRYEINSQIRERNKQASAPVLGGGGSTLTVNPDPTYKLDKNGWGPRAGVEWRAAGQTLFRASGGLTTLLTNLYQDNLLTGANPFVIYPKLTAAPGHPVPFGAAITPEQLPVAYTTAGAPIFASGDSKLVPANTQMDVVRFEQELAANINSPQVLALTIAGITPDFRNGYIATWTAGFEQKVRSATIDVSYVGTAGIKLAATDFLNGYPGASPQFAPYARFGEEGNIIGGYAPGSQFMTNRSHSSYHGLQVSAQQEMTRSGLGFQASYSFAKSLDDSSAVVGGFIAGYSGATSLTIPEDPFHTSLDKGPSSFDIRHALNFSLFQDLHIERAPLFRSVSRKLTAGWQLMGIGTFASGLPFTVYSGIQQTAVGSQGADRPDQIGVPVLSTSRKIREDYFGLGASNTSYFSIPIGVPGGTGPNQGVFGTLGRNTFRGPGMANFDMAVIKDTPLFTRGGGERASVQFRSEFFNVFNLVNFGLPSNILLGPGFGEISRTAGTSRQIQFSLKMIY